MRITLYFDGACWPNPGGRAAYGWHVRNAAGELLACGSGPISEPFHSNNVAEWEALRRGLTWLVPLARPGMSHLAIRGDSRLVIKCLNLKWRSKVPVLREKRDACRELLSELPCPWEARWMPREMNAFADALAGQHMGRESPRLMKPWPH